MKIKLNAFVGRKQLPGDEVAFSRLKAAFPPALPSGSSGAKKSNSPKTKLNSQRRSRAEEETRLTLVI